MAEHGLRHYGVLPYAGGLFDQPYELLMDMFRYGRLVNELEQETIPDDNTDLGDEIGYVSL